MDTGVSVTTANVHLFAASSFNCHISKANLNFTQSSCFFPYSGRLRLNVFGATSTLSSGVLPLRASVSLFPRRFKYIFRSASGDGNDGVRGESGGGGGGDDGGSDGGDASSNLLAGEAENASTLLTDAIILDVGGMTCTGCSASVKRILESQPRVSHANVDLASETAVVWPVAEAKITPNWQEELGQALAKHLTTCGFSSKVHGQ